MSLDKTCILFFVLAGLLFSSSVYALKSDRKQAVNVEADKATISKKSGTSTYTGNVLVQQGSIKIKADKLIVYTQRGKLTMMRAQGNPVHFSQSTDKNNQTISAVANTMTYQADSNTIIFEQNAELRQGKNSFASNRIIYDITKDIVNAGQKSGGDRVTITIQPADDAPAQETNDNP